MSSNYHRTQPVDLLDAWDRFAFEQNISLSDPQSIPKFTSFVGDALANARSKPTLLHGHRTQAMFEALLVSLGQYSLLKTEDSGMVHPSDRYIMPDFRVVLPDGDQWLIEVKNAHITEPFKQERRFMRRPYREKLENYATATGAQLKLAVYWSTWGLWTLNAPDQFIDQDGDMSLDMQSALVKNEMASLGDRWVGTKPPLRFRIEAAHNAKMPVGSEGLVRFTAGRIALYSDQAELTDEFERLLAWIFMLYGDWIVTEPIPIVEDGMLAAIEFRWFPEEETPPAFPMVGLFSRMFGRYYSESAGTDGNVERIRVSPRPDWFAPLLTGDYKCGALPLWLLKSLPNTSPSMTS